MSADRTLYWDNLVGNMKLSTHIDSAQEYLIGYLSAWGDTQNLFRSADVGDLNKSLTGVAIGPRSDVDFVEVQYSLPTFALGAQAYNTTTVCVGQPLIASIPGPNIQFNSLPVANGGQNGNYGLYGATFKKEGVAALQTFGSGMVNVQFTPPIIELVLSFGDPKLCPVWGQRRHPRCTQIAKSIVGAIGTEEMAIVYPVFGRKQATISLWLQRATADFRVSEIVGYGSGPAAGTSAQPAPAIENQIAPGAYPATTRLTEDNSLRFDLQLSKNASWLIVYLTPIALGAAPTARGTITVTD